MIKINFSLCFRLLIGFVLTACLPAISKSQENITSVTGDSICPSSQYIVPVMVTNLNNLDSIALQLKVPVQTMQYLSFRQVNAAFPANSFKVSQAGDTIRMTWGGTLPVSLGNEKLLDLIFKIKPDAIPGTLTWLENLCLYREQGGALVPSSYINGYIRLFPSLFVAIEEIDATCPGECNANVGAHATGGKKPYSFLWNGENSPLDSILTKACGTVNNLQVIDANGCILDTSFKVSELLSAKVELETEPDTVYIQNPGIKFSFSGDQNVVEWLWDFGDGSPRSRERTPQHVYSTASAPDLEAYTVSLTVRSTQGCDTTILFNLPVSEAKLFIPNVFTPNGDNINDKFIIAKQNDGGSSSGSNYIPINQEYLRVELVVLDRWGRKVFEDDDYKNNWDGGNVPDGTYYYRLNTFGYFKDESYKGAVTILRGNRN